MKGLGDVVALVFIILFLIWLVILLTVGSPAWGYRRGDSGVCYEVLTKLTLVPFAPTIAMSPVDDHFCEEEP